MLIDTTAQDALLDGVYGSGSPASFQIALFDGDPVLGGAELAATGGYARVTVANDSTLFPGASGGSTTSVPVAFAASTAAWSDTANYWVAYDAADGVTAYGSGLLSVEISVTEAGTVAEAEMTIYYNQGA